MSFIRTRARTSLLIVGSLLSLDAAGDRNVALQCDRAAANVPNMAADVPDPREHDRDGLPDAQPVAQGPPAVPEVSALGAPQLEAVRPVAHHLELPRLKALAHQFRQVAPFDR